MDKRNFFLILIGCVLEYFDLALYAAFSAIIAKTFMPCENALMQLLNTCMILSVTFLARPFGSLIFGYIGDMFGRSRALAYSILGMSIATLGIGLLPSFAVIGLWAPGLLIFFRALQGASVGGEGQGAAVYALERFESDIKPGLLGAMVTSTNVMGALIASVTAIILSITTDLESTWRYPFIISGVLGLSSSYLRRFLVESYRGRTHESGPAKAPLKDLLKFHRVGLFIAFLLGGLASAQSQVIISFFNIYFVQSGFSTNEALTFNIFGILLYFLTLFIGGKYGDKIGNVRALKHFFVLTILLTPFVFLMITLSKPLIFLGVGIMATVTGFVGAPIYAILTRIFPVSVRYTGVCFGFNVGIALLGGTYPTCIAYVLSLGFLPVVASLYLVILSCICLYVFKRNHTILKTIETL